MLDAALGFIGKGIDAAMSYSNAKEARESNEALQRENMAQQREFAQHGIRWKVADAQAAGLHPLAALGAQTSSFSNVVGGDIAAPKTDFGGMGQDIGRAIDAGSTASERTTKMQDAVSKLATTFSLEKASLENDLLRTNIAKQRAQLGPPFPSAVPLPRPGPDRSVGGIAVKEKDLEQKAEDFPQTKIVRPFGYPLRANPWFNDGQQFEDRYGDSEIGSTLKFGVNTIADHIYTGYGLMPEWQNWASAPRRARQKWYRERR